MGVTPTKISSNDRFIRWQSILRDHVTFINNLIMSLALLIAAYFVDLLSKEYFNPIREQKAFFTFGFFVILLSVFLGIATTLSRMRDFKFTLKKIRVDLIKNDISELEVLKTWMKLYGDVTWCLLYWQIGTFILGAISLIISICNIYSNKLF